MVANQRKKEMESKEEKEVVVAKGACHLFMRLLAFTLSLVASIVIAVDKQTKVVPIQISDTFPTLNVPLTARWHQMSAILYFLVTNAIACTYAAMSLLVGLINRGKWKRLIAVMDALMVALLFSGIGAASAVGVIGYRGNSHVNWNKVCNVFGKFCHQMTASVGVSLLASLAFLLLLLIPLLSLHRIT